MTAVLELLERRWLALTLALAALVAGLSLIPKARMPGAAQSYDKVEHLIAYAVLALPAAYARPRGWPWVLVAILGWSATIEFLQPLVNRATHLSDFMANLVGVVLGVALALALRRLRPA
jgi:VanZ family protein